MGRNFDGTSNKVQLGDVANADFLFDAAWTLLVFFRVENTAADDNGIISKWSIGSAAHQFSMRVDSGTAGEDSDIEVYQGDGLRINEGHKIELNIWYLTAVTNPGDGVLELYTMELDGTIRDNARTGSTAFQDDLLTEPIKLGRRDDGPADEIRGDIAWVSYFTERFSLADVQQYLWDPEKVVAEKNVNCLFAFELGQGDPEPDFSGRGESGVLTGTTVGDDPPISPEIDEGLPFAVLAAPAPADRAKFLPLLGVA